MRSGTLSVFGWFPALSSVLSNLRDMLHEYALQELRQNLVSWIARVASASNPGDAPSRTASAQSDGLDRGLDRSAEARIVSLTLAVLLLNKES